MSDAPADGGAGEELQRRVTIQNEKTKLTATAANNTAVTLFAGGVVIPIVALSFSSSTAPPTGQLTAVMLVVWALVAIGLHWWARSILNGLR